VTGAASNPAKTLQTLLAVALATCFHVGRGASKHPPASSFFPIPMANDTKFKPGVSGNPNGRPKGSKNQITLLKESMELMLREEAAQSDLLEVMRTALDLAKKGDRAMIKLILELHMSKGTTQDNSQAAEKVQININGPSQKVEQVVPLEEVALLVSTNEGK
jgi:hypothetical protein